VSAPAPVHYYHVWTGDRYHWSCWEMPAQEHFGELRAANFTGEVRVGVAGGMSERLTFIRWLKNAWPESVIAVQADEGFEQVTIDVMHAWAKTADPATPVLYAHTKGALNNVPMNARWRQAMDQLLIEYWPDRVNSLHTYDSVGCHWLTHEQFPAQIDPRAPMWGGNFWWANAGYLAGLERVRGTAEFPPVTRWGAEGWVGRGFPKVLDLKPGWPDYTREDPVALG
jgi:hypothetical protein